MDVITAVACAKELEGELIAEVARAREERLLLKSLNGAKLEERLADRRAFEERADALQKRLRLSVRANASSESINGGLKVLIASIQTLALQLAKLNQLNHTLAERALACTKAYVRALAPRPSAYDRRGVESSPSALSSMSRRA